MWLALVVAGVEGDGGRGEGPFCKVICFAGYIHIQGRGGGGGSSCKVLVFAVFFSACSAVAYDMTRPIIGWLVYDARSSFLCEACCEMDGYLGVDGSLVSPVNGDVFARSFF